MRNSWIHTVAKAVLTRSRLIWSPGSFLPAIAIVTFLADAADARMVEGRYDALNRIVQTVYIQNGTATDIAHEYDAVGNRTKHTTSQSILDTDGDGMPDIWESNHGLNPSLNDSGGDPDADGLTNIQEYQKETNPKSSDTDNDGMPDGWEVLYSLNPLLDDGSLDKDGDHFSNLVEYNSATDPADPESHPSPGAMPWLLLLLGD
jgi:hypothetical protein